MQALVRPYRSRVFHSAASVTLIAVWIAGAQWAAADGGGEIAYIANGRASIHVVEADGTGDRQFVSAAAINNIAWSPDGKILAYTTVSQALAAQRIYLFDTGAGRSTELKSSVATYGPIAFFPDGTRLAAPDGEGPTLFCDGKTVAIDLSTGQSVPLGPAMNRCVSHLQVTPDGAALIATMHGGDPSSGIANVVLPSGQQNWIDDPSTGVLGFSGAVTLDNQTLAYITLPLNDLSGPGKLVLADRDGSNQRVAWQPERGEQLRNLDFAPDGGQLAVGVLRDSSFASLDEDIWVVGTDGGTAQKVAAGFDPAWRPGQASGVTPSSGQASPTPADASAAPPGAAGEPQVINCSQGRLIGQGVVSYVCDDRMVYQVNPDAGILTRYNPSDGASELTGTSWPITLDQSAVYWTDERGRACAFRDGLTIQCSGGGAALGSSPAVDSTTGSTGLSDGERADILAAVDRANAAWTAASQSLDATGLSRAVAGQELSDDLAELDQLRRQGHTRKNVNTLFSVTDVTLAAANHATVRTHETWYAETYEGASGRLLQRTPPATYDETYTLENHGAGWIVTRNDV